MAAGQHDLGELVAVAHRGASPDAPLEGERVVRIAVAFRAAGIDGVAGDGRAWESRCDEGWVRAAKEGCARDLAGEVEEHEQQQARRHRGIWEDIAVVSKRDSSTERTNATKGTLTGAERRLGAVR